MDDLERVGDFTPPLGGHAPPLQCNRIVPPGDGNYCGREATWHILWTADLENGLACDEHYEEAKQRWVFYAAHQSRVDCSMPGAVYDRDRNICVVPDTSGAEVLEALANA